MTLQENISSLLNNKQADIDPQWVEKMCEQYPYFILPAALLLKRKVDIPSDKKEKMIQYLALNAADRDSLSLMVDDEDGFWTQFYPRVEAHKTVSTNDAISTFLDNYGSNDPKEEELLERLIFNPTPDYAQLLAKEEEESVPQNVDLSDPSSQEAMINAFILKSKEQQGHYPAISDELGIETKETVQPDDTPVSSPETAADDTMLSESLAKIYIKQRKYSKAYEIIRNLSLNFPEKSIYFADQLRFLQKLMINQRYVEARNRKQS